MRTATTAAAVAAMTAFLLSAAVAREASKYDPVADDPAAIDAAHPPAVAELNFESAGDRLNGLIYLANGAGPHSTVILLHGYPGNEKNLDLAQALRRAGHNVLFFHYRGAWGSGGAFSFSNVIEDVGAAADMLRARAGDYRVDPDRLIAIGHSMGGFAALHGAARDEEIRCVAGLAAADFGARAGVLEEDEEALADFAAYADNLSMLAGWSGEKMLAELRENAAAFSVAALAPKLAGKRVLLVAGAQDAVLPPAEFHYPMVEAFGSEEGVELREFTLPGDHSFSWSRIALIRTVTDWAAGCGGE